MNNYTMSKNLTHKLREYIFIILTATVFLLIIFSKCFSEENIFIVDNVRVEGDIDVNFTRNKYIDKAFSNSFETLMSKILLSSDLNKVRDVKIDKIKKLIKSFQILEETYRHDQYKATFKIFYNDFNIKKLLLDKNISFSQPKNISAIFYPVLFINSELQNLNDNYFYKQWHAVEIKNDLISFILPIDDLEDIYKIKQIKNKIEDLNIEEIAKKYNTNNYVFALMESENDQLNIYLNTNFNNNKISKNLVYKIDNINNKIKMEKILKDLKLKVTDIWRKENVINLSIPLSIRIKFKSKNLKKIDDLKNALYKISIIDSHFLEEVNVNHSFFKIHYYGNPKKLTTALLKFGYELKNDQGNWAIHDD